MTWQPLSPYCLEHRDTGARIAKCAHQAADGQLAYRYLAYGPDQAAGWSYRAWSAGSAPHWSGQEPLIRYAIGRPIPQPRVLLSVHASADEAKAAIEAAINAPDHSLDATKKASPQEPEA